MNRYSPNEAAVVIQRAVRNRQERKNNPHVIDEMRQAELETLKARHRQRLEAKEREYLFLSKMPAQAVLRMSLKKQADAATVLQAFWRGKKARKYFRSLRENLPAKENEQPQVKRSYKPPPDNFYRPIDPETHDKIVKQIRLRGEGNLEQYKQEYSRFLDKQVAWEKIRKQKYSDRNEIKTIVRALQGIKSIEDPLTYRIEDATPEERARARIIKNRKIPDPKRWWKSLEDDDEWEMEVVGTNIIEQIQAWKMDYYKKRQFEFAGQ